MFKILSSFIIMMMSFSAMALDHDDQNAELHAAINGFDHAYTTNDVETYFSYYGEDATVYYGGNTRQDVDAYHEFWTKFMKDGGGVEINDMSDHQVKVMPGGDVAISTSFVLNRTRAPGGSTSTSNAYETDVWQKIDGKWKIISMHYNVIPEEE